MYIILSVAIAAMAHIRMGVFVVYLGQTDASNHNARLFILCTTQKPANLVSKVNIKTDKAFFKPKPVMSISDFDFFSLFDKTF